MDTYFGGCNVSALTFCIQGEWVVIKTMSQPIIGFAQRHRQGCNQCRLGCYRRGDLFLFISLMQEKRNQRVHYPQGPLDRGMQLTSGRDRPTSRFLRPFGSKRQSRATTITIRENEQGDTLRVSTVTDRDRLRSRENRRTKQEQSQARLGYALQGGGNAKRNLRRVETVTVTRIDTVYIGKDSIGIEDKKIGLSASADGVGSKKSGLSELFLCRDSG